MSKNNSRIPIYKYIWCKIRLFQRLNDIDEQTLASCVGVQVRTLKEYDKQSKNITLGQIDSFLYKNGMTLSDLLES